MNKKFDISKIKIEFRGENEPKDERLMEILKKAYTGELLVRVALIKTEGIKPFSDFKPKTSKQFRNYFEDKERQNQPLPIYVYPLNDFFVMSDDYNSYYLYKEKNYSEIMCVLIGDSESEFIIEKGEPFLLPPQKLKYNDLG